MPKDTKNSNNDLDRVEARYRAFLAAIPDHIFRISEKGDYIDFHTNRLDTLFVPYECVGKNVSDLLPAHIAHKELLHIQQALKTNKLQVYEYELPIKNELRYFESRLAPAGPTEVLAIVRDVTERKLLEKTLFHQAVHDPLTGLPNRRLFLDRLSQSHRRFQRHPSSLFGIALIDVDNFKLINDTLGHHIGDQFLVDVAFRLQSCLREKDTLARIGGDEFAVLFEDLKSPRDLMAITARFKGQFKEPIKIFTEDIFTSVSVGIATSDDEYSEATDLLRHADIAMYAAKAEGGNRFKKYRTEMSDGQLHSFQLQKEIRQALQKNEFKAHYQPLVDSKTGRVAGLEALVRWHHPEKGIMAPGFFINAAEQSDLIIDIGSEVLRQSSKALRDWLDDGHDIFVSVNVSPRQFYKAGFLREVKELVHNYRLPRGSLKLEITENLYLEFESRNFSILQDLIDLGVDLCIDDFGTGYSSIGYLKRFPIEAIKIDRSFIAGIGEDKSDENITRGMIYLAKGLDLHTVGEGVETAAQASFLASENVRLLQGYLFSKPVSRDEVDKLITTDFSPLYRQV